MVNKAKIRKICIRVALFVGAALVGALTVISVEIAILYSHAPAGPAQAKGWEGRYYNLVYTLTPCSSGSLVRYEDADLGFFHFSKEDVPGMERRYSGGEARRSLAETMLRYTQTPVYSSGNTYVCIYKPKGRKPASPAELKNFVDKYAEENVGSAPEISYGSVPGSPFSAYFRSGAREGVCFTDQHDGLYCFKDQDLAMQRGSDPFAPTLLYALGFGAYSLDEYPTFGIKDWFTRPYREKRSECNFTEIKRTVWVKGKR